MKKINSVMIVLFTVISTIIVSIFCIWIQLTPYFRLEKNQKVLEQHIYQLIEENLEQTRQIEKLRREVQQDIYLYGKWE